MEHETEAKGIQGVGRLRCVVTCMGCRCMVFLTIEVKGFTEFHSRSKCWVILYI